MTTGKPKMAFEARVSRKTMDRPSSPPMMHRKALSSRNSVSITLRLAPMAFLSPICEVRSRTVTNMILATPNIPTINESIAIDQPPLLMPPKDLAGKTAERRRYRSGQNHLPAVVLAANGAHGAGELITQLLHGHSSSLPCTIMMGLLFFSRTICFIKPRGINTQLSYSHPPTMLLPCFLISPITWARLPSFIMRVLPTALFGFAKKRFGQRFITNHYYIGGKSRNRRVAGSGPVQSLRVEYLQTPR